MKLFTMSQVVGNAKQDFADIVLVSVCGSLLLSENAIERVTVQPDDKAVLSKSVTGRFPLLEIAQNNQRTCGGLSIAR